MLVLRAYHLELKYLFAARKDRGGENGSTLFLERPRGSGTRLGPSLLHQVRFEASGQGRELVDRACCLLRRRAESGRTESSEKSSCSGRPQPRRVDQRAAVRVR